MKYFFLLLTLTTGLPFAAAQQLSVPAKGTKRAVTYDSKSQMPVVTVDIPASWNFKSNVRWDYNNCVTSVEMKAWDPGGTGSYQVVPQFFLTMPANTPPMTSERFIAEMVTPMYQKIDPGATIVYKESQITPASTLQNRTENLIFAVNLTKDGAKLTEAVFAELTSVYDPNFLLISISMSSYGEPTTDGKSAVEKLVKIYASTKYNGEWIKYQSEVNGILLSQKRAHGNAETSKMINETAEYIRQSRLDTYRNNQESRDRVNRYIHENIQQINTVSDPYTGSKVGVSNEYNNTWFNSNGEYLQSGSSLYNPNQDKAVNNVEWRKVK